MQNKHFKEAMRRYGMADNSIVDYLYISNQLYLGTPARRIKVPCAPQQQRLMQPAPGLCYDVPEWSTCLGSCADS